VERLSLSEGRNTLDQVKKRGQSAREKLLERLRDVEL